MYVGLFGGLHHLVHGGLSGVVAVPDVVGQGRVEEDRLLRDDSHAGPDPRDVQRFDVVAVDILKMENKTKTNYLLSEFMKIL
jgi:hypothetical protein